LFIEIHGAGSHKKTEKLKFEDWNSVTEFAANFQHWLHDFSATELAHWATRFDDSATDFWSSVADFYWHIKGKTRFQTEDSRILRPTAYFGAEALQIWWSTIITHSLSSNSCMNPSFYVSYLLLYL